MSAALRGLPANGVLILATLALCVLLALDSGELLRGPGAGTDLAVAAGEDTAIAGGPGIEAFRSAIERPLFSAFRRPAAPAAPVASGTASAPPPTLQLVGIVAAGEDMFVLVRPPGGRTQRLTIGEAIGEWQLDSIDGDRAGFSRDGVRFILPLMRRGTAEPMPVSEPWLVPPPAAPNH